MVLSQRKKARKKFKYYNVHLQGTHGLYSMAVIKEVLLIDVGLDFLKKRVIFLPIHPRIFVRLKHIVRIGHVHPYNLFPDLIEELSSPRLPKV